MSPILVTHSRPAWMANITTIMMTQTSSKQETVIMPSKHPQKFSQAKVDDQFESCQKQRAPQHVDHGNMDVAETENRPLAVLHSKRTHRVSICTGSSVYRTNPHASVNDTKNMKSRPRMGPRCLGIARKRTKSQSSKRDLIKRIPLPKLKKVLSSITSSSSS
jgi:hypothetical protein